MKMIGATTLLLVFAVLVLQTGCASLGTNAYWQGRKQRVMMVAVENGEVRAGVDVMAIGSMDGEWTSRVIAFAFDVVAGVVSWDKWLRQVFEGGARYDSGGGAILHVEDNYMPVVSAERTETRTSSSVGDTIYR